MITEKNLKKAIVCISALALLAACTPQEVSTSASTETSTDMSRAYTFTLPDYVPQALVDSAGYETGGDKTVLFCTREAGDVFEIRSAADNEVVYTGKVKEFRNTNAEMSYGQFSSFQMPGEYYVYTDGTGSSYSFLIEEGLNTKKLKEALGRFAAIRCGQTEHGSGMGTGISVPGCHIQSARLRQNPDIEKEVYGGWHTDSYGGRDTVTGCLALRKLLLCLELNPKRFVTAGQSQQGGNSQNSSVDASKTGDNEKYLQELVEEAIYEAEWLFRMQDDNGGVYGSVLTGGNEMSANLTLTEIMPEATVSFAGTLAQASFVFRKSNPDFSERALTAAKKAWEYYTGHAKPMSDSKAFAAASELYRMTGERKYENVLSTFFTKDDFTELFREDEAIFFGSYSYMGTTQPVNVEVCNTIMTTLLEEAEQIAERANKSEYFVSAEEPDDLLQNMMRLTVANHVIYNHEYTNILENHVHYLYGRNAKATNYVTGGKDVTAKYFDENSIYSEPVRLAGFVLLLAAM